LSNVAYEVGAASLEHAKRLSYHAATAVANKVTEAAGGGYGSPVRGDGGIGGSTPGYIQLIKDMKHPPKILTIAPLMRAWNPPSGESLEEEEEDTGKGTEQATTTNNTTTNTTTTNTTTNTTTTTTNNEPATGPVVTASYLMEDHHHCVDIVSISNTATVTLTRGTCCAKENTATSTTATTSPSSCSSTATSPSYAPSVVNAELVMEKLNNTLWNINVGSRSLTVVDQHLEKRRRRGNGGNGGTNHPPPTKAKTGGGGSNGGKSTKKKKKTTSSNKMKDQWLQQMEMTTYAPKQAPMWARPTVRIYAMKEESAAGASTTHQKKPVWGGEEKANNDTPWWWKVPGTGNDEGGGATPMLIGDGVEEGGGDGEEDVVRVVQIALSSNMFT
jgi:hypothetical protein